MESAIVFGLAIIAIILIGPWIVAFRALHKARKNEELAGVRWESLRDRLQTLERDYGELKTAFAKSRDESSAPTAESVATTVVEETKEVAPRRVASQEPERLEEPTVIEPTPPVPVLQGVGMMPPAKPVEPGAPTVPITASVETRIPADKQKLGLEEKVGTNWLNKVGIVLLVLGMAFLISTLMQQLGPAGKVLIGFVVSGALLGAGVFFEKNERYRVLARAGIAGGWALLFFTAYAMHHVSAARVLESQTADLFLMMVVAAAMVWHTLRYNSQVVTGLAFFLAFLTVNIGHGSVFSLTAGVVLAAALCVLVVSRRWFELEIFGILATYLNHWYWLMPIIEPMGSKHHMFPEFVASAVILCLYWLVFRVSYIVRNTDKNENAESVSTVAAILNGAFLLAIMRYQSVRPELAFWFLLALGCAELTFAYIARVVPTSAKARQMWGTSHARRAAFVVLAVIGSALLVAAIPFRYSGMSLAVLWVAEAQALIMAGVGTDEPVFRRLGLLAMAFPVFEVVFLDAQHASVAPNQKLGIVCTFAALACYADSEWFPRRWAPRFEEQYERWYLTGLSYAGVLVAMLAAWVGLHDAWVAVVWAIIGFVIALAGNRLKIERLGVQANILAAAALIRVLAVNVELPGQFHAIGLRLITMSCVAALLYLSAPWTAFERSGRVPSAYTWAGSFLVALVAWYELRPISVALAWALFGILLIELGIMRKHRDLLDQGLVAMAAAFTRIFFVNLNADGAPGQISPRVYTVVPLALIFYYAYQRLYEHFKVVPGEGSRDHNRRLGYVDRFEAEYATPLLCWFGGIAIASVMRFEMGLDWVVAAWAGSVIVLLLVALGLKRRVFVHQALAASFAVLFRGVFHNFSERSYFSGHWGPGSMAILASAALVFAALPLAFRVRTLAHADRNEDAFSRFLRTMEEHPHQPLFFVPLALVTVLLALELRSGMITVGWGLEGVVVFLLALWIGERSYRLAGLGLLLLCVGKILVVDVWQMQGTDRYVTLIVTGGALLLVSFLYSRYREELRQYL